MRWEMLWDWWTHAELSRLYYLNNSSTKLTQHFSLIWFHTNRSCFNCNSNFLMWKIVPIFKVNILHGVVLHWLMVFITNIIQNHVQNAIFCAYFKYKSFFVWNWWVFHEKSFSGMTAVLHIEPLKFIAGLNYEIVFIHYSYAGSVETTLLI